MKNYLPLYSIFSDLKMKDVILGIIFVITTILVGSVLDWQGEKFHGSAENNVKISQLEERIKELEQKINLK